MDNKSRSMNRDLDEGMTDGKYKKIATAERGGVIDAATALNRAALTQAGETGDLTGYYGMVEAPVKVKPDGRVSRA